MKKIVLAGGCFWGVQAYFDLVKGITKTTVGYIDGMMDNPTYQDVLNGSGHTEALYLEYDESVTSLSLIFEHYFNIIDPTSVNRQGNDIGLTYRTGIYCYDESDIDVAIKYIVSIRNQYVKEIVTTVKMSKDFTVAENYHQHYLDKNPNGYCHINLNKITNIQEFPIYKKNK
ncbi:MAG: peptide-methionine (S)-S-oxide reductase MsrA [Tenericutes bacterium]|jgi:methionine-S-sulfoxide reductase|nr:peptide-methionine (S)-S-oxide reductase MsrA [Mycoplasmatota bacterium]